MAEAKAKNRITWIDGLKGLACIGVFTHHFFLRFFTASYYGPDGQSLLPGKFDELLSYKPYGVFINGNFWVCMFIVLASFLPALQIMKVEDERLGKKLGSMVLKRYPRLMLPAFIVCFLNYVVVRGLNFVGAIAMLPGYGFKDLIINGLFKMWIQMDISLQGAFWTLHYLLFVPLFAAMLATADRKPNKHMPFVLIAMFAFFIHTNSVYDYYLAGVIGVLLADVIYHKRLPEIKSKAVGIIVVVLLVLVGLWMGGYPTYVTPSGAYIYLAVISLYNNGGYAIIHLVGVLLILLACFIWQQLELPDFLSAKGLMWLGKNCYGIFLVHTLLIEYLGLPLMTALYEGTGNLVIATILVYVILLVAILVVAEIFNRTVERFVNRLLEAR